MSAELFANRYLYRPRHDPRLKQISLEVSPFIQNFLHDAESLWWVALWCLARLDPAGRDLGKDQTALQRRMKQYLHWFPTGSRQAGNAFDAPLDGAGRERFTDAELSQVYHPVWEALVAWRRIITMQIYDTQYVQGDISPEGMEDLHVNTRSVIKTKELLDYTRGVGSLQLVARFE